MTPKFRHQEVNIAAEFRARLRLLVRIVRQAGMKQGSSRLPPTSPSAR